MVYPRPGGGCRLVLCFKQVNDMWVGRRVRLTVQSMIFFYGDWIKMLTKHSDLVLVYYVYVSSPNSHSVPLMTNLHFQVKFKIIAMLTVVMIYDSLLYYIKKPLKLTNLYNFSNLTIR